MQTSRSPTPDIPDEVVESLARASLEAARRFYAIPENRAKFEKWLAEKNAREAAKPAAP